MKKRKSILKLIILLFLILIVLIFAIKLMNNNNHKEDVQEIVSSKTTLEIIEEKNKEEIQKLQDMGERDRIQYYFGKYIDYIQEEAYGEAYNLLYDEFKDTYFPTFQEYVEYIQEKYPFEIIAVDYENIERNGEIYVLWVSIIDPINGNPTSEDKLKQNIVIKENDFNDFVLSFSV